MRKFIFALMASSLLSCSPVSAFWQEAVDSSLEVGVGYRQDNIKFKKELTGLSSSSNGSQNSSSSERPRFKSERKFKDMDIWLIEGRGKYVTCDNIYLRGAVDYGWITAGKLKRNFEFNNFEVESDLITNHRHLRGNVWDGKLALGYQFKWCDEAMSLSPVVGYGWNGQEIKRGHGDDYSYSSSSSSSYSYSDYSFSSRNKLTQHWKGPFIGIDLDYRLCCDWNLFASYEYHWADYHSKEKSEDNIGINGDFYSDSKIHMHGKNGSGNVLNFGVNWDLCDCWTLGVRGEFQWWDVDKAHERRKVCKDRIAEEASFACNFNSETKRITWDSASVILDLGVAF